jgi:GMP synthase (glutamine-hydrolysing)
MKIPIFLSRKNCSIPLWRNKRVRPLLVFRHVPHEGLGTIVTALARAGLPHRTIDIAHGRPSLPPVKSLSGLIVMGGPMGVYEQDRYPFLKRELAYIRNVIEDKKPILGICLGSQLIARALGARVYPNREKEIGWYRVHLTSEGKKDPLMNGENAPWVFQWHGDTFDLPTGARRLASSPLCKNQAFRFGQNVYGLQYHLEVDKGMILDWLDQPGAASELAAVGPRTRQKIEGGFRLRLPALRPLARCFFSGFADRIAR